MTLLEFADTARPQPNALSSPWTAQLSAEVQRLWVSGKTATEISAEVGMTRNAVLGKLHRMKLTAEKREPGAVINVPQRGRRPDGFRRKALPKDPAVSRSRPASYVSILDVPKLDPDARSPHACALVDLDDTKCHWPIGDPAKVGFHFCGAPTVKLYCPGHHSIAYRRA